MRFWIGSIFVLLAALSACSSKPVAIVAQPVAVVVTPVPRPVGKDVVILVSENAPAYSNVAKALARQLGRRGSILYLNGSQMENIRSLAVYKNEEHKQFVSIGLNAALAAKTLTNRQVVFCQVFNYQDYGLLSDRHKGVSMLPSLAETFSTWRALAPHTTDIGIITGPGFDELIQTARAAAKVYGFTLHHEAVSSDKGFQYAYKKMSKQVQGYWLIPDNRVLSGNILRDVMTFSIRNSKQVAVFSEELLNLGGLFSVTSDPQNIAHQVLYRLDQAQNVDTLPGSDIVYLDKSLLHINAVMVQRLNLNVPALYRKYQNAL